MIEQNHSITYVNGSHKNGHNDHHAHTVADIQRRFYISIASIMEMIELFITTRHAKKTSNA